MAYTLNVFARVTGGRVVGPGGDVPVARWAYDSRLPFPIANACFLALDGPRRSGAAYLPEMHERGVTLACVSEREAPPTPPTGATYLVVPDVLRALQALAAHRRAAYRGTLVAVVGSNGKTIVKEYLSALLGGRRQGVYRSPGSANSQLGVALSVLAIPPAARVAILELGVSRTGEMAALRAMAAPVDLGIFTSLGSAHDAGFANRTQKAHEKLIALAGARALVVHRSSVAGVAAAAFAKTDSAPAELLAWSAGDPEPLRDELAALAADAASRENLGNALAAARWLGTDDEALRERLRSLPHPTLRLSAFAGRDGCRVIDDTYSADREGLRAAVEFFAQHRLPGGRSAAVLGPLRDAGLEPAAMCRAVAEATAALRLERVLSVGAELADLGADLPATTAHVHCDNVAAVNRELDRLSPRHATVLVKGPRDLQLERVTEHLRDRAHDVRLDIDLGALADNLRAFRSRLRPATRVCVMVKARAYGSGSPELAKQLADRGVDYLAVAYVDEGVELRRAGSRLPIIVANASAEQATRLRTHDLEPEITSLSQLRSLRRGGMIDAAPAVHLKIDTGMHRLGFAHGGAEFEALLGELATGAYRVASVFSHLSASDDPAADGFTRRQDARLRAAADRIDAVLDYRPLRHLVNSAGAWRFPEFQYDMVRLGIGLYGAGPLAELALAPELAPVHRWVARIVRVRHVAAGEVVGYGLGGRADHDRHIGVVNVGYADGLRRAAGHGRLSLFVGGRPAPTVGSICMDFCMIDLADCPGAGLGDEVELFGPSQPVAALATCFDTIAYEVFTGIGERVRRVYYR